MRIGLFVAVMTLAAVSAPAGEPAGMRPFVSVLAGSYGKMGYRSPAVEFTGGLEIAGLRTWSRAWGSYSPTDKVEAPADSVSFGAETYFGRKFIVGAGLRYVATKTPVWEKHSLRFRGGIGIRAERAIVYLAAEFSGKEDQNNVRSVSAKIISRPLAGGMLGIEMAIGPVWYHQTGRPSSRMSTVASLVGVSVRF